jgi:DNA polymerase I-like protein with 3'-5' exonuclease and polymerase domains
VTAIAIDTETTGLYIHHGHRAFMVTACDSMGETFWWEFPVDPHTRKVSYERVKVCEMNRVLDRYDTWVFHNASFDIKALRVLSDLFLEDHLRTKDVHDTQIMSHLLDSRNSHGLKDLAKRYLGLESDDEVSLKRACMQAVRIAEKQGWLSTLGSLPGEATKYVCGYYLPALVARHEQYPLDHPWHHLCLQYAIRDVERTIGLYLLFSEQLQYEGLFSLYQDHMACLYPVLAMESHGMFFHSRDAMRLSRSLKSQIGALESKMKHMAFKRGVEHFNWRSTQQRNHLVFGVLGVTPLQYTEKGAPSLAGGVQDLLEEDLTSEQREFLELLEQATGFNKTLGYLTNYLEHELYGYLYPNLNLTGTRTTRFSSSNPNGQNIKKASEDDGKMSVRGLFGPPPGKKWYCIDYSSLQLIIFFYESGDKKMVQAINEGKDLHDIVARFIYEKDDDEEVTELERRRAKNVNYGMIFGGKRAKVDAVAEKEGAYDLFVGEFETVVKYHPEMILQAKLNGFVRTAWGYPLLVDSDKAFTTAVNYVVQGDEGEIVKRAMVLCHDLFRREHPECRLVMQVHDELIFECPVDYEFPVQEVVRLMELPAQEIGWRTPVEVSLVKERWDSKEKVHV